MAENSVDMERMSTFKRAEQQMISVNDNIYGSYDPYTYRFKRHKHYTDKEVEEILTEGGIERQRKLSQDYFGSNGFYFMTLIYYATLLKYVGVLIPNPSSNTPLNSPKSTKLYREAVDTVENMRIQSRAPGWALKALINGTYFGVIVKKDKDTLTIIDLPAAYCKNNFKDLEGNNIVEFNLSYFDTIVIKEVRKNILKSYPDVIREGYRKWKAGKGCQWIILPSGVGICLPFTDGGDVKPPFINMIPATLNYDQATDNELDKAAEEVRKILVQKVPHNASTNELVFEPDEALEMHRGAVNMMKGNKNVSVLTTYADVDSVVTKSTADTTANIIENMAKAVYYEAGVSGKLFGVDTATAIDKNIKIGISMMMMFSNKIADFITKVVNELYKTQNLSFTYKILPVSYQNEKEFIEDTFKLASSGYSFIVPALASGISQRDLINLKDLENNVLKLDEVLLPLSSAFTASAKGDDSSGETGAPKKDVDDKAPETLRTEESRQS